MTMSKYKLFWNIISCKKSINCDCIYPDNKVHGTNMGPTWVLSAPDGPHVGPMNLAIRVSKVSIHRSLVVSITITGENDIKSI